MNFIKQPVYKTSIKQTSEYTFNLYLSIYIYRCNNGRNYSIDKIVHNFEERRCANWRSKW